MATSMAAPLEAQLSLISGVTSISSTSSLGQTQIQVEFDLGRSIEGAAQDVQTAISAAGGLLPKNLPNPPTYEKVNPADALLMSIATTSEDLPISAVDEYVENYLAPQISRIPGVGLVDYHGQQKPAIRIQINPMVASAMGVTLEDVRAAVVTATVNSPKGTLDGARQSMTLDTTDQIFDASTFNSVIVAYRNGAPVRVSDLGRAVAGRREHPGSRVAQRRAGRRHRCAQAAGIQHQSDRAAGEGRAAASCCGRCRPRSSCGCSATGPRRSGPPSMTFSSRWRSASRSSYW